MATNSGPAGRMLPFELRAAVADSAGATALSVEIGTGSDDSSAARPYIELLELFGRAVRSQVLPRIGFGASGWEGGPPAFVPARRTISAAATVVGLAPEAYWVLVALLAQSAHAGDPPTSVSIRTSRAGGEPASAGIPRGAAWDRLHVSDLPVRIDGVGEGGPLEITMEFASPIPPPLAADVDEALTVWNHLVFLGGYRFSFEPDVDFEVVLGDTTQVTRTSMRHVLDPFRGPLLSLDGPLRVARHLARLGHPIHEITMEG